MQCSITEGLNSIMKCRYLTNKALLSSVLNFQFGGFFFKWKVKILQRSCNLLLLGYGLVFVVFWTEGKNPQLSM